MIKTDDGKECYNPIHEARKQAAEKLDILLRYAKCKVEHLYSEECSYEHNKGWD